MRILWVEDNRPDIYGMEAQCEAKGWQLDIINNFYDAAEILAAEENQFDVVVIDIILPWGERSTSVVADNYPEESAGLRLLEAMRGSGEGQGLLEKLGLPDIHDRHSLTSVIVLSKLEEMEELCSELNIVHFFNKMDYNWKTLLVVLDGFAHA